MEKKITRFKKHIAGKGGWSEWVFPKMDGTVKGYLFKCCDCGLVHEMEFGTFLEKNKKKNTFEVIKLPKEIRAMFRARRFKISKQLQKIIIN